jgi:hypothetical protein
MEQAGLEGATHHTLVPAPSPPSPASGGGKGGGDGKICVTLWLAHDPRIILAGAREVA